MIFLSDYPYGHPREFRGFFVLFVYSVEVRCRDVFIPTLGSKGPQGVQASLYIRLFVRSYVSLDDDRLRGS